MAQQKQGKKGRKYGRNNRAPSAKLQQQRTAKNKRIAIEKAMAHDKNAGVSLPKSAYVQKNVMTGQRMATMIAKADFTLRARAVIAA